MDRTIPCCVRSSASRRRRPRVVGGCHTAHATRPPMTPNRRSDHAHARFRLRTGLRCIGFGHDDVEPFEHDEERAGERGGRGRRAHMIPVDLLAQRAGDGQQALVAQVVLGDRHQLGDQHVLERHDAHLHREHRHLFTTRDHVVVHRQPLGREDQVDEHVAVPRLHEPLLRRILRAHARVRERGDRALDVLPLDHEVEVVPRLRPAPCPRREAAAEQERHVRPAQRGGRLLQRGLEVGERLLFGRHGPSCTRPGASFGA